MLKNKFPLLPVVCSGCYTVIVQCLFIREFLTIFSGNELVIGILLTFWLLWNGIGSLWGGKKGNGDPAKILSLCAACAIWGFYCIRFFPLLFPPGRVIPAYAILALGIAAIAPAAFVPGYMFGFLSRIPENSRGIYAAENTGSLAGAGIVFGATMLGASNAAIVLLACAPAALGLTFASPGKKPAAISLLWIPAFCLFAVAVFLLERPTINRRYAAPVSSIRQTREGELALLCDATDTTLLLNNMLYRSTARKQTAEQAVHVPMAQRDSMRRVLVIFDKDYFKELEKYPGCSATGIETLQELAAPLTTVISPERFRPREKFDCILSGSPYPSTTAASRFYTTSFFHRMRGMLSVNGVFSFTLLFSENFMPPHERRVYESLSMTLASVFPHTLVFPAEGAMTFMGSNAPLTIPEHVSVETEYLGDFILPGLDPKRIKEANTLTGAGKLNTPFRPVSLYFALVNWLRIYEIPVSVPAACGIIIIIILFSVLPRTTAVFSVATSGCANGVYSLALMLMYQTSFGSLYAEISLLLFALSSGFVAGARVRLFPFSDGIIGGYVLISCAILYLAMSPPHIIFLLFQFGMGFLSAAQFVTRSDTAPDALNSADLFGGILGMSLATTLLIPLFGVLPVVCGVSVLKAAAGAMDARFGLLRR